MSQDAPMGHDITGTVYDIRGSIEEDDHADETYADDLTERMNLRVPEWMYWDIESVADTNGVKPSAAARELIERALGEWGPYAEFGNDDHTYGDCKCPRCANTNPISLRWIREPDHLSGVGVDCEDCGYSDDLMVFRRMEQLDAGLQDVWLTWALRASGFDGYQPMATFVTGFVSLFRTLKHC